MTSIVISLFVLAIFLEDAMGLDNGVARTPPMGWNPFSVYSCDTTEAQYRAAADALVHSGLKGLGYQYLNLDCGWQSSDRTPSGTIMWNTTRIPSGIPALADYVHGLGLRFGVHSDAGYYACDAVGGKAYLVGSLGHEQADASTFAGWGADYLKYDNCYMVSPTDFVDFNPSTQEEPDYTVMRNALSWTGRDIIYSISEWGVQDPARWAGSVANSWRMSNDIGSPPSFASLQRIINQLVPITQYAKPGSWNDLDLLEVGNPSLSPAEARMHFVFWAAAKSPLFISADLITASNTMMNILGNTRIIAVNQDSLGQSISFRRRYTDMYDVWSGPLSDGSTIVVLLNWRNASQSIAFDLFDVGLDCADITNLWTGDDLGTANKSYTATADAHGVLVYKLTKGIAATQPFHYTTYHATASSNVLSGGATQRNVNAFLSVVANIGHGGSLTFVGVDGGHNGGTKRLRLSYINADYTFTNTDCSNCRRAEVSVNGKTPVAVEMPISGQDWDDICDEYIVSLDGFVPGTQNKITFANPNAWAPDMYSIDVQV